MRSLALAAALLLLAAPLAARERYRIETHSPQSWARYYQRIGLGHVHLGPFPEDATRALHAHCDFLDEATGHDWIPLGYSLDKGYMLCYRSGPFSAAEAGVFCARLIMAVLQNAPELIECGREQDGLDDRALNPYLRRG
jgi:hypothetical protein